MRFTLQQRRDVRNQLLSISSMVKTGLDHTATRGYIEDVLDDIDYLEPPRWQQALRERAKGHGG